MKRKIMVMCIWALIILSVCSVTATMENKNQPPYPPTISGPTQGKPGEEYEYTIVATDPDGDDVGYSVNWGQDQPKYCIGLFPSGEKAKAIHQWSGEESYVISVCSIDCHGAPSEWVTLEVTISRNTVPTSLDAELSLDGAIIFGGTEYLQAKATRLDTSLWIIGVILASLIIMVVLVVTSHKKIFG